MLEITKMIRSKLSTESRIVDPEEVIFETLNFWPIKTQKL